MFGQLGNYYVVDGVEDEKNSCSRADSLISVKISKPRLNFRKRNPTPLCSPKLKERAIGHKEVENERGECVLSLRFEKNPRK